MVLERPNESPMQATHRKRVEMIRDEAINIAGTATKIAQAMAQVLERGGAVNVQSQVAYITGGFARLQKDWGVVEYLQANGAQIKAPARKG